MCTNMQYDEQPCYTIGLPNKLFQMSMPLENEETLGMTGLRSFEWGIRIILAHACLLLGLVWLLRRGDRAAVVVLAPSYSMPVSSYLIASCLAL